MAIQSTSYHFDEELVTNPQDKELQQLLSEVNMYLFQFGNHWFYFLVGRRYFYRCIHSWVRITSHLEKFLQSPRTHYSIFMSVLDIEMQKFPKGSFYGKQLKSLALLLSKGPIFTITSQYK